MMLHESETHLYHSDMDDERRLFARFQEMGIVSDTLEHEATRTVADSRHLADRLAGGRSKSLLLQDKQGRLTLATALGNHRVDLKKVASAVGSESRLTFADDTTMKDVLGVAPGHLTPFALVNDTMRRVGHVVLDEDLMNLDRIWAHPLRNTASTAVKPRDLRRFCELHARSVLTIGLAQG